MTAGLIPLPNVNGRNDRFIYAKVRRGDQVLFLKKAKTPELELDLQRELLWAGFVNYIREREPEAHIRGVQIVGFDEGSGLLMEYIDAPLVASPSDGAAWKAKIDRYAHTLSILDKYAEDYNVTWPTNEMATINTIDKTWRRWFGDHYENNLPILKKAYETIIKAQATLSYRLQHGDLTPWQIFEDGQDWVIYDGEKAGNHLPRYNDLAYGYGRLFTRLRDRETAAQLLGKFIVYSKVDRDNFFEQFLPVMTFRAVGMLADAYTDKEHEDYTDLANELLALCFDGQLEDFLPKI